MGWGGVLNWGSDMLCMIGEFRVTYEVVLDFECVLPASVFMVVSALSNLYTGGTVTQVRFTIAKQT
jgi:hypothetical protein